MTLTQLRCIVAIADAGLNITLAAERVHATQPGLSKQLKQLEGELGFQIFLRKGKSLDAITAGGRQVIERARTILAEAANIRALAANLRSDVNGQLVIVTTHTQARFVLPPVLAALKRRFPEVGIRIEPHGDAELVELLGKGAADLAIVSTAGAAPAAELAIPLFRWERVIVAPRAHPLAALGRPLRIDDIAAQPLVSYESSLAAESSLRRAFAAAGHVPKFAVTARDADLIKTYVRAGLGVGILAEMAFADEDLVDLRVLPADGLLPTCTAWVVLRRDRVLRDYALDVIATLAPHLDRRDLVRVVQRAAEPDWPSPPHWHQLDDRGRLVRAA
ncbi:MAG TPA: LysR substrate-binding domain-containing protein [Dokdonella sp.]|uniref:LysR substrate-binding domain-containing protein n=1 Tax=Dokdonella sp. TaxID=2291710 RepID=UPI0025B8DF47|nr:LysR substrate-binding domain-containing protein [Dokdonella sp.]MBX3690829.1 LysR family transcriptional regulator [Dokdonella sp.]HNR91279.1 LysR substrate-binding domain-containing protein [Dokdonella sp.]